MRVCARTLVSGSVDARRPLASALIKRPQFVVCVVCGVVCLCLGVLLSVGLDY